MATGRPSNSPRKRSTGKKQPAGRTKPRPAPTRVLDDESRHEIVGIVLGALSIVLGITVLTETAGVVPRAIATILRSGFGLGAYAIPLVVLLWAVTFFLRSLRVDEVRVGIGLGLLLVAVIGMLAIGNDPATEWEQSTVIATGGYIEIGRAHV